MVLDSLQAIAGGALVLVLPGLAWSRALFPEWRFRGPLGLTHALTTSAFAVIVSLATTILVGFGLLGLAIAPYPATWTDPVLELLLALIALAGFVVAALRGGWSRHPPSPAPPEEAPVEELPGPWLEDAARLRTEGRRIRHRLRRGVLRESEREELERQLAENDAAVRALERGENRTRA